MQTTYADTAAKRRCRVDAGAP